MEILKTENLKKAFGGLQAVNGVSIMIEKGELSSIIGPNGAGKTTLFNLITGYLSPDSGQIRFKGEDIFRLPHYKIVKKGIGRSFQRTNIFPTLTVFENVRAAVLFHKKKNFKFFTHSNALTDVNEASRQILESLNLLDKAGLTSSTLAHGDQKLLDIGIALALEPDLLLMDEPTAGMSPEERWNTVAMIQKIWKTRNMTVVFIEHDMDMVFSVSQKIRVLHYGAIIAEGTPK
ncbi:MAG: ABC transporter ATP-binding protein, partial [Deltaproteobacteria bacterium]|nr:ABC transporter ATP-binding protein [Deltaproteobacteria bacterium]